MNVNLIRFKPVIYELKGIRTALERIADCYERELEEHDQIIMRPNARSSAPDPDANIQYVNEEEDEVRNMVEHLRREDERKAREEDEEIETGTAREPFGFPRT